MPRPFKCRRVCGLPRAAYFKPAEIPVFALEQVNLTVDEFEAIRLADLEGLYQEEASRRMNISRQTFGNIIESAHKKIADVIVNAKALKIEGGAVQMMQRYLLCPDCTNEWVVPYDTGGPLECPKCRSKNIREALQDHGWAVGGGPGRGRGRCRRRGGI
ncbi:MAG: DUF134 domain-containing protein [Thermodesulfobacteriota bacterium]